MVAANGVVEGVATVAGAACRLRIRHIGCIEARLRVLTAIGRKVLPKHILQALVEPPTINIRLGARAARGIRTRHRRASVVTRFHREAHAVLPAASPWAPKAGRWLRQVLGRVVEEAAPHAVRHGGPVTPRRPWCNLRVRARSRGRDPRYRRHPSSRRLQHSQLFPVVAESVRLRFVPGRVPQQSVRDIFGGRRWGNSARRDVRLLFAAASWR